MWPAARGTHAAPLATTNSNGKSPHSATERTAAGVVSSADTQRRVVASSKLRRSAIRSLSGMLALVVLLSIGTTLNADEETKKVRKGGARDRLVERFQDLNLTDDQEAKIAKIRKEYGPKVAKAGKNLAALVKEEVEKIRDELTMEQKEKLAKLKELPRTLKALIS
jgi:hypothetical protein